MREDVRQALAIDASSTMEDRTIDITTTSWQVPSLSLPFPLDKVT